MKLKDARISIFVNREHTTIELYDTASSTVFADIKLTPEQLSSALSRMSQTECEIELHGIDMVGKTMEHKSFQFEIPAMEYNERRDTEKLHQIALKAVPDGWIPDKYYGSQGSFTEKDGKHYANVTIRRWI